MRAFFERIERPAGVRLMWEPRGPWPLPLVESVCHDLDLLHVVDPFVNRTRAQLVYQRLHGMTGWRHRFTDAELQQLATMLPTRGLACVMFNNASSAADAKRFESIVAADVEANRKKS